MRGMNVGAPACEIVLLSEGKLYFSELEPLIWDGYELRKVSNDGEDCD